MSLRAEREGAVDGLTQRDAVLGVPAELRDGELACASNALGLKSYEYFA